MPPDAEVLQAHHGAKGTFKDLLFMYMLTGIRPNIVQVHAWRQAGDEHYLVLQYVAGGSLADRLKDSRALGWQRAAEYAADVADALQAVHASGMVHRDVKPANILWDEEHDEAVLTDFGISGRVADARSMAGTPGYIAPEAFEGRAGPAMDVFSLAATLFHLVTGELPFHGSSISAIIEQVQAGLPEADVRLRGMPEPLEQIVRAGLASAPDQRPTTAELATRLRGTLNHLLADTLAAPGSGAHALVELRLIVSRLEADGTYRPVAMSHTQAVGVTRDLKRVPRPQEQVRLQTGDRVRIEVITNQPGHVAILNVGPTGNLNLRSVC